MLLSLGRVMTRQLLEQLALLTVDLGRELHLDLDQVVTPRHGITQLRHPLTGQGEDRSGLGAGGNLQLLRTIHGLHLNRVAEDRLEVIDRHLRVDVDPIATQVLMGLNRQEDVEVTGRTTPLSRVALVSDPQTRAGIDSRRDIDAQLLAHLLQTLAAAGAAGIGDDLTGAFAGGTGRHLREAAKGGAGGTADLTSTAASAAAGGATAALGT